MGSPIIGGGAYTYRAKKKNSILLLTLSKVQRDVAICQIL